MADSVKEEIELKLLLPAGTLSLLTHPRLSGTPVRQQLHTVYFDTWNFKLAKQGVALRVRRVGRRWIQTLKTNGSSEGGLSMRVEMEVPVSGPAIEFERFPPEAAKYVQPTLLTRLVPVFETRFTRRTWNVIGNWESRIEVALDEGEIRAGNRTERIQELELEFKSGRRDALYALALELGKAVALWPCDCSKAERGTALARNAAQAPVKAEYPTLVPQMSLAEAWRVIASNCVRQFCANLPGIVQGKDPEYLHQARVALRRFRSAYALFKRGFPLSQAVVGELRRLNAILGPARDWDVFCAETLPPIIAAISDNEPLIYLANQAEWMRRQAQSRVTAYLLSPAFGRLLLSLARRLSESHPHFIAALGDIDLESFATHQLNRRQKQIVALASNPALTMEQRHLLRIRIKRMRYALDCFSNLYSRHAVTGTAKPLAQLQDILGHMNDAAVADRLMGSIGDEAAAFRRSVDLVHGWQAASGLKFERSFGAALQTFLTIKRLG
ncbi:MAG: CHAD domain-containing protein [Thiobacillaceae bacterium]